ncbi:O-methyltransferase [Actinomyces sp.]|uniref:O-methyltransferase n=1 Tax=Actinomyces sp. TaxID=29317 RepID=UPI0026DBAA01|nr:O-methyltransferase [Actinomyces sp.]MDO4899272.1 O-methyltransferase [Actinomyces sp.]
MAGDKTLSWSYTEEFPIEGEPAVRARMRGIELGTDPVSPAAGAALRLLTAAGGAKSVAEIGTGTGVSGLWILAGMGADGVLTTIDVEPEFQREARRAFDEAGYPGSRTRIIQGRASDVMPRMAAQSYDMVVLDVSPEEAAQLVAQGVRMLRAGGVLVVTHALWKDHVADPARRDATTVAARELGKTLRDEDRLHTSLLPVGDGLLVAVRQAR